MSDSLAVLWTVSPAVAPRPWLHCSRCGAARPFVSSGRFRVNANGRRLDAWLIYRCAGCARAWNRPVLERRPLAALEPGLRAALEANDPALAERVALDLEDLRRRAGRVETAEQVAIARRLLGTAARRPRRLELRLVATAAGTSRLDRVLAEGLGLARARLLRLHEQGRLSLPGRARRALGRPLPARLELALALAGLPEADAVAQAAAGFEVAGAASPPRPPAP